MKKILGILPHSIGGRLTTSSILDGFRQNGFKVIVFDELKMDNFDDFVGNYDYIVGYDFSPIKLKIDHNLNIPCIAYFSDVIEQKTSGVGYIEYNKYLKNDDIKVFYWDRALAHQSGFNYQAHFVNTQIYKNFAKPTVDVIFMGRLDTDLRLKMYLKLNQLLPSLKFKYYGIQKHYEDAISRCANIDEIEILKNTYSGFIDNELDMACAINETKIVYNINAQGITSLNYRTIQTLACERLLISDFREELDLFDNVIPVYDDVDDLARKISFYIENNEEYQKIVSYCKDKVIKNHDSKICVQKMLDIC